MNYMQYIIGLIIIGVGIRTIYTQKIAFGLNFWNNNNTRWRRDDDDATISVEQNGIIAILVGIVMIASGVIYMTKGPTATPHPKENAGIRPTVVIPH